ncbi:hypothetical protein GLOTRDRAFT_51577, partial [Gloeophyllum trabeum ATCC 11539]
CLKWITMEAVVLQLIVSAVDIILMIRVYALYDRNRRLLATLSVIYAGLMSLLCYALTIIVPRVTVNPNCSSVSMPSANCLCWLPSVSFETLLFALTLFKCYQYQRLGWRRSPILRQFVRDGTWAFALIFGRRFLPVKAACLLKRCTLSCYGRHYHNVFCGPLTLDGRGFSVRYLVLTHNDSH